MRRYFDDNKQKIVMEIDFASEDIIPMDKIKDALGTKNLREINKKEFKMLKKDYQNGGI